MQGDTDEETCSAMEHLQRMKTLTHDGIEGGQGSLFLFSADTNAFCRVVPLDENKVDDDTNNRFGVIQCGSNKLPLNAEQQVERLEKLLTKDPLKFGDKFSFHIANRYGDTKNLTNEGHTLKNLTNGIIGRNQTRCSLKHHHTEQRYVRSHEVTCDICDTSGSSKRAGAFHIKKARGEINEYSLHITDFKKSRPCFIEKTGEFACNRTKDCVNPFGCEPGTSQPQTFKIFEAQIVDDGDAPRISLVPWSEFQS